MRGAHIRAAALLLPLLVAACGSDTQRTAGSRTIAEAFAGLVPNRLIPGAGAPEAEATSPDALGRAAIASFPAPSYVLTAEPTGATTVIGLIEENRGMRTFASPAQQNYYFRGGILVATRGLGDDLMSAEVAEAGRMIRARQPGRAARVARFLDGDGVERPLPLDCRISVAGAEVVSFAGLTHQTQRIEETCAGGGTEFANTYNVTAGGEIVHSRQWVSPLLGHVILRRARG